MFNWFRKKGQSETLETVIASAAEDSLAQDNAANQNSIKYMGLLETYGVSWPLEKVARDSLQNFFDTKKTLDDIDISVTKEGEEHVVRIKNRAEYDYRRLLHLGGTTKTDDPFAAGGFGEGAKIAALVLLRDYGFSQIRYGSKDWELDFTLDELPEGEYVEQKKGLFAGFKKKPQSVPGNFIEFKTKDPNHAKTFAQAKDLFYHSENPDFQNPSLDIPGVGGFKYIPREEGSQSWVTPKGNFYYVGQRRHFDKEEWNTVEHLNIWTHVNNVLKKDRDRGVVTRSELTDKVIPLILDATKPEDLKRLVFEMKPIWSETSSYKVGERMLQGIAQRLAKQGTKLDFEEKYLAAAPFTPLYISQSLAKEGYVICSPHLKNIGMKGVIEKFNELQQHYRVETSPQENRRIAILHETADSFQRDRKDVWIFDRKNEKSIIQGQYDESFIWLSRDTLRQPYHKAMATYLHETDHKHGTDMSAEFSYALTDTLGEVIGRMAERPELFQRFQHEWDQALEKEDK